MNNLEMAKGFVQGCDTITSLFVGLGQEDKVYCLYANWKETVWGKTESGVPIARVQFKTQHLVNLSTDFINAKEKAKTFCKKERVIDGLRLAEVPSKQNPYEFRTPEEIAEEKAEKARYELIRGDVSWIRSMNNKIDRYTQDRKKALFQESYEFKGMALQVRANIKNAMKSELSAPDFIKENFEKASVKRKEAILVNPVKGHWKDKLLQEAKATKFIGNVGDKVEVELTVEKITGYSTQWNYINIYNFKDNDGNVFIYKGATDLEDKNRTAWNSPIKEGHKIVATGKIKEHTRYSPKMFDKLSIKQTRLERIKVLRTLNVDNNGNIIQGAK